jgi:hypothetical protein
MNEKTPLIGTPVNLTVFRVDYEFKKAPRKEKLPKAAKPELDKVGPNTMFIASSDPSGQDVFSIAQRLVLGPNPYEGSDFRLLQQQRALDVMGLASVTSWDKIDGKASDGGEVPTGEVGENETDEDSSPPDNSLN